MSLWSCEGWSYGGIQQKGGIVPFHWVIGTEDVKICLQFLIGSLGLSISLGIVGSGEANIVLEEAGKFLGEGRHELGATIRDESIM